MRVLVVGAGSIGRRHIRNLLSLGVDVSAYRYRTALAQDLAREFGIDVYPSLDEALGSGQDAVVVCNSTDQHMDVAIAAASLGLHLYIEKPLSNTMQGVGELEDVVSSRGLVVEIGCTLRLHPNLVTIRDLLHSGSIGRLFYARAWVGQYLPEWRPGTDYRQGYSAKADQGGGVLLDLIHELDYLLWWCGGVEEVSAFLGHVSDLETEAEDVAQILLRFKSGAIAQLHLDCVRPFFGRGCEIVGRQGVVTWDYSLGTVEVQHRNADGRAAFRQPEDFERNTMFLDHMKHFLNRVQNGGEAAVSLSDSVIVLQTALAARLSSDEKRVACPQEIIGVQLERQGVGTYHERSLHNRSSR